MNLWGNDWKTFRVYSNHLSQFKFYSVSETHLNLGKRKISWVRLPAVPRLRKPCFQRKCQLVLMRTGFHCSLRIKDGQMVLNAGWSDSHLVLPFARFRKEPGIRVFIIHTIGIRHRYSKDCPLRTHDKDFPGGPVVKYLDSSAGDTGLIPNKIPCALGQLSHHTTMPDLSCHN